MGREYIVVAAAGPCVCKGCTHVGADYTLWGVHAAFSTGSWEARDVRCVCRGYGASVRTGIVCLHL